MEKEPTNRELLEAIKTTNDTVEKLARSTAEGFAQTAKNFQQTWTILASLQSQVSGIDSHLKGAWKEIIELHGEKLHADQD